MLPFAGCTDSLRTVMPSYSLYDCDRQLALKNKEIDESRGDNTMEKTMEKIVALAKSRGFVYPFRNLRRTCQHLGLRQPWRRAENNVKKAWWKKFIMESPYNVGVDCAILMNPQTWVASGHLGGFSDLMDCKERLMSVLRIRSKISAEKGNCH